jgi:signal peptidase I
VTRRPSGSLGPADATDAPADATDAPTNASQATPSERSRGGALSFLRELPVLIVLAFTLAILLKTFVVQAFFIPSGSMEPALEPGDRVLVTKVLDDPSRGDVIVFADPNGNGGPDRGIVGGFVHWLSEAVGFARPEDEDFIKRVVGLPGEVVEIRRHAVYVDGRRLAEPYLTPEARASMADFGPVEVPRDALFVMGDNRGNSNDSRARLGFVPVDRVIGRAFMIIWPPSRAGWVH